MGQCLLTFPKISKWSWDIFYLIKTAEILHTHCSVEGLDSIYTVLRSTRFNISQLAFNLHCASIYTICFQSTRYSIYSVYHLLGIHSTRYSISSKNHKKTILCLNLHDIHSTQFSIYTVFDLHCIQSTLIFIYTVFTLYGLPSTLVLNLQVWFQSQ